MNKTLAFLVAAAVSAVPLAAFAQDAAPAASASPVKIAMQGKMLYAAGGGRVAPVYRVAADGSPQVILEGKLVTVPVATLSEADGKVMTSLSRKDLRSGH